MQIYHKIYLKMVPNREKHVPPRTSWRYSTAERDLPLLTELYTTVSSEVKLNCDDHSETSTTV